MFAAWFVFLVGLGVCRTDEQHGCDQRDKTVIHGKLLALMNVSLKSDQAVCSDGEEIV